MQNKKRVFSQNVLNHQPEPRVSLTRSSAADDEQLLDLKRNLNLSLNLRIRFFTDKSAGESCCCFRTKVRLQGIAITLFARKKHQEERRQERESDQETRKRLHAADADE